jgi:hypothetical protein
MDGSLKNTYCSGRFIVVIFLFVATVYRSATMASTKGADIAISIGMDIIGFGFTVRVLENYLSVIV